MNHDDFDEYEKECKRITKSNNRLLSDFAVLLGKNRLAESTVNTHVGNIDFFINHFLLYFEALEPRSGLYLVEDFLGDWFPRKAMWANPGTVRRNASSLKKFYLFLVSEGQIELDELTGMEKTINENLNEWAENAKIGNRDF